MNTHEEIAELNALPDDQWRDAVSDFLKSRQALMLDMAHHTCQHFGIERGAVHTVADVAQTYMMVAFSMIQDERAQPGTISQAGARWEAMLRRRGSGKAREVLQRELGGSGAGAVTRQRRARFLGQARNDLYVQLQRDPTDRELVEFTNDKARRLRRDASRQSLHFTLDDVRALRAGGDQSLQVVHEAGVEPSPVPDQATFDSDSLMHPFESPEFVKAVVDACTPSEGEPPSKTAQVASVWFGQFITGGDTRRVLETSEVAQKLGMTHKAVNHHQARIRKVAVEVFTKMFPGEQL